MNVTHFKSKNTDFFHLCVTFSFILNFNQNKIKNPYFFVRSVIINLVLRDAVVDVIVVVAAAVAAAAQVAEGVDTLHLLFVYYVRKNGEKYCLIQVLA